jgi:hypothetical protein
LSWLLLLNFTEFLSQLKSNRDAPLMNQYSPPDGLLIEFVGPSPVAIRLDLGIPPFSPYSFRIIRAPQIIVQLYVQRGVSISHLDFDAEASE